MSENAVMFEAVITPHRSLSARGMKILIAAIVLLSAVTTSVFWLLGAWPVAGFSGIEVTLAILLLRHNTRSARARECIELRGGTLHIMRVDAQGRREDRTLDLSWMRVVLRERPGRVPKLLLTTRMREEEIASQLGEDEKRDLASALDEALNRWRNPVFDNKQLTANRE